MKNVLIAILLLFTCSACQETKQEKFEKEGVSLTCPNGWRISGEKNLDDHGYYLSMEKEGASSSGLLTVSWINGELDLDDWIDIFKDEIRNHVAYRNSNLRFVNEKQDKFNGINTTSVKFTATILGLKHEGIVHFFYEGDKTFALLKQEAVEDKAKNKIGFELIERSFMISGN